MKALFLTRLYYPHTGGVEKHVCEVSKNLKLKGKSVKILTEKYNGNLKDKETIDGVEVIRFHYPKIKFLGLFSIWFYLLKNINLIREIDVVHAHDVSIWYLPFRFLFPKKPFYSTFHGWEGVYPIPLKNILIRRLSAFISWKNICVGNYIEKYYGIKANIITYGAEDTTLIYINVVEKRKINNKKIVYVGRLEADTGLLKFLKWLDENKDYKVEFCGDGSLKNLARKYGKVYGFIDPKYYLRKANICVPGGYLSALEALAAGCKLKLFWDNPLKRDYWKMSPFIKEDARKWMVNQTWDELTDQYLNLWGVSK